MKLEEYIEKLNEGIDFEEGYLSDIAEETPKELHINIMKALENKEVIRNNPFSRKRLSLIAAVFILVLFVSGLKNFTNLISFEKRTTEKSEAPMSIAQDTADKGGMPESNTQSTRDNSKVKNGVFEIMTKDTDILGYLKGHGESIGDNLYVLNKTNFEELKKLLDDKGIVLSELSKDDVLLDEKNSFKIDEYIIRISN